MRIASLIILLIVTNTTYSGFSDPTSYLDNEPLDNQPVVANVGLQLARAGVDSRELEATLSRATGALGSSYKKIIDAGCSTLKTVANINLTRTNYISTTFPVDLRIPVTGSYIKPVALRLQIGWDVYRYEGELVPYVAEKPLENCQNELVPIEFQEPKLVKEFAALPYIPLPTLSLPVHEEPMTIMLHQVVCVFFSAALLLATIRDYQLTSAALEKKKRPVKLKAV